MARLLAVLTIVCHWSWQVSTDEPQLAPRGSGQAKATGTVSSLSAAAALYR
ncbi:hypothetical protein [cf. Phormidesmis sp. LEGE 11477]|uniref:hypothetical protein n=1 Tax=cf. Phormidesmis sp. LEGE 11477 TaxID=1828680 RepID=UPI0019F035CE|nr:hypothetical protein [cf. Phormidesmis sp. LEGE 11477]MBE9059907.1 hypothetical protein [cf. Phormidesmis sp. LEGE 11477]